MDEIDKKVRRHLLRPLVHRTSESNDSQTLVNALRRLDSRAIGEDIIDQLSSGQTLELRKIKRGNFENPSYAAHFIAYAGALYAARRISTDEYVLFSSAPVEQICSSRWLNGEYDDELGSIVEKMERIEEEHGLEPDESWGVGQGPEEYGQLTRKYDAILDRKFVELLRDFELNDLADLAERDRNKFDQHRERGRRAIFHRSEYAPALHDIVLRHEHEARRAASAGAYGAAVTSLGAGIEGLLLYRCLRSPHKACRISAKLPRKNRPRFPDDPSTWTFANLIEVCVEAGWLSPVETPIAVYNTAGLAHMLRVMRNHVHPGRRAKDKPWCEIDRREYEDAEAIYVVLLSALGKIRSSKRFIPPPA